MIKVLSIWNAIVTAVLVALLVSKYSSNRDVKPAETSQVIRTGRLEIIDQAGKMRAAIEAGKAGSSNPAVTLYNDEGREAAILTVNSEGYGTMYFQSKQTEAKVSVGYLWGSDTPTPAGQEDPLSSWGIRVRGQDSAQTSFGMLNNGQPIPLSRTPLSRRK